MYIAILVSLEGINKYYEGILQRKKGFYQEEVFVVRCLFLSYKEFPKESGRKGSILSNLSDLSKIGGFFIIKKK